MITTKVGKISYHTPDDHFTQMVSSKDDLLHVTFGRMNPPTVAHIELIASMENEVLMGDSSQVVIYLSETKDINNPLTVHERVELIEPTISPLFIKVDSASNMFNAMAKADKLAQARCARGIVWWVGSDRLEAAKRLWLYSDHWITPVMRIVELERAEDDERSATAMRVAALNSEYETFERLAGTTKEKIPALFTHLRSLLTNGSLESST